MLYKIIVVLFLSLNINLIFADGENKLYKDCGLYLGLAGGYGSTTWGKLVPTVENQNFAINLSAPIKVTEGGGVWGAFLGYEFAQTFALEANYMHFPNVNIEFDENSLFSFLNDGVTKFNTHTETVNLMAKIMLVVPNTALRIYSSLGIAGLHRQDILIDNWLSVPTFGTGINFRFNRHIMGELSGNYTAGYGESQLNPTEGYFPFLYAFFARVAYIF